MYKLPQQIPLWINLRNLVSLAGNPIDVINKTVSEFGQTYYVKLPAKLDQFIFTQDPAFVDYILRKNHLAYHKSLLQSKVLAKYMGYGLLTNNGEDWRKQRRLIQPGFKKGKIESLAQTMQIEIDRVWEEAPKSKEIDLSQILNQLTFRVVAKSLFSSSISDDKLQRISDIVSHAQEMFSLEVNRPHMRPWYQMSGQIRAAINAMKAGREIFQELVNERRESQEEKDDLLDMLLQARYEDGTGMDDEKLMDEMIILFIAGHETTANALSWTFYELAKNPENIARLREDPTHARCCIQESMRLYPPVWAVDRLAMQDDAFGDYNWPANTQVIMYLYGLHRDPNLWQQPEAFMPERFIENPRPKGYYPFGAGPRMCIGNHFAMLEMELSINRFFEKYSFELKRNKVKRKALVTLRAENLIGEIVPR